MKYISTRNEKKIFSFKDVFLKSLAPDGGLFVPKKIPKYSSEELKSFRSLTYNELAVQIILKFCSDEFKESEIKELINNSYKNFRVEVCQNDMSPFFGKEFSPYQLCTTHPHQIYFEFLAEHGIVGSLLLLSILFFLIFRLLRVIFVSKNYLQFFC